MLSCSNFSRAKLCEIRCDVKQFRRPVSELLDRPAAVTSKSECGHALTIQGIGVQNLNWLGFCCPLTRKKMDPAPGSVSVAGWSGDISKHDFVNFLGKLPILIMSLSIVWMGRMNLHKAVKR